MIDSYALIKNSDFHNPGLRELAVDYVSTPINAVEGDTGLSRVIVLNLPEGVSQWKEMVVDAIAADAELNQDRKIIKVIFPDFSSLKP